MSTDSFELKDDKTMNIDEPTEKIINSDEDFDIEKWVNYTGLKIREHKPEELEAFKKPFQIGWKRELSIRAQLHSSGKRIVDISYISPCNQVVLRSYVELGVYLRNDQSCGLEPENFTFAKQPVYKYPDEIIKQLLKTIKHDRRSIQSNGVVMQNTTAMPSLTPINFNDPSGSESNSLNNSLNNSINLNNNSVAEGRSKRKRTAPTRFDDEEYFTEQTLSKKKLIIKPPLPTSTPLSNKHQQQQQNTTSTTKLQLPQQFSPKQQKVDYETSTKQDSNFESLEKESTSSVKSSKSNKSAKSDQQQQQQRQQVDSDEQQLLENNNENDLKYNNEDIDSTHSKKDENSQDQAIQFTQSEGNNDTTAATTTSANAANTTSTTSSKPTKPKSSKRKSKSNAAVDQSAANSFLNESLLVESLLQNGNFECTEDNDLSDCDLIIDTMMNNDVDQELPLPPCSLICGGRAGDLPTLRCSKCCCLYHPSCVKDRCVFLKDTKQFVCPNCAQPEDLNNAIEDFTDLLEQSNDLAEDEPPLVIDVPNIEFTPITTTTASKSITSKQSSTAQSKQQVAVPKQQNPIKQAKQQFDSVQQHHLRSNGLDGNLMMKRKGLVQSNQIRMLPQIQRNLINQSNQPPLLNHKQRTSFNQLNTNANQLQEQLKQNQFNIQLLKRLSQLAAQQQNIMNLKSNVTHIANGAITSSSLASRRTQLENMNKSLESSQVLIESFKKYTSLYQQQHQSTYRNGQTMNRQMMNANRINNNNNNNLRFNSTKSSFRQQQQQQQQQQINLNQMQRLLQKPTNYQRTQSCQQQTALNIHNSNDSKYLDYLNKHQNGFKQMINQYEALDMIFDYLNVRELLKCRSVNRTFNRLADEKQHWKQLNLKGLAVVNWQQFASQIVDKNQTEELNLEGLRLPSSSKSTTSSDCQESTLNKSQEDELWKDFKLCHKYFQSLRKLSLGRISIQQLSYLLSNDDLMETNDQSNQFHNLEELSIRNLYDQTTNQSSFFSLRPLIDQLANCKNLKSLRIESNQGISNDESTILLLNGLSEMLPNLKSLFLPSLRGFAIKNFEFLTKLNSLECLEIGSCESWTTNQDDDDDNNEQQQMQTDNNNDRNDGENQNSDDQFMNENSNQENEFCDNFDSQKQTKRGSMMMTKKHRGAFKYLSQLKNLKELYLTDIIIDEMSNQLPLVFERMSNLESLGLGCVTVSPDATQTLNLLCNTLRTKLPNLRKFSISTEDPHTNHCCFDLLIKRLDNLDELKWKVSSQVEDNGNCLVPFVKERGLESDLENEDNLELTTGLNDCIEMIVTCHLSDILRKNLSKTKFYILPQ